MTKEQIAQHVDAVSAALDLICSEIEECLLSAATSTGRCNTLAKSLSRCFEVSILSQMVLITSNTVDYD